MCQKCGYSAIVTMKAALKAVERNGDALRYVLTKSWFLSPAAKFGIEIEIGAE